MQLVQDGGFARGIQPKHHDLKLSITKTKSTRRYKKAVREHQPNSGNKNLRKKNTTIPSSRWGRRRHRTACGTPAPSAHGNPLPSPRTEIHSPRLASTKLSIGFCGFVLLQVAGADESWRGSGLLVLAE